MAFLWRKLDASDDWVPTELGRSVVIDNGTVRVADSRDRTDPQVHQVIHLFRCVGEGEAWVMLASPALHVSVNGVPAAAGVRRLADRDAIRSGGGLLAYFSSESIARAEPYPGAEPVFCPRCKRAIRRGDGSVRCPRCRVWHHHGGHAGSCWQYSPTCALCDQASVLDEAAFDWTPGEL